uniref:Uncharacterized protein n=1 Tax=Erpetoichthys calabaricus TaxID=27687 RepID=A0A8C4X8V0_ERPCA
TFYYETREANMLVQSILNTEQVFIKLDGYLNYIEGRELRKKELLHKAWTVGVSEPVQDKLQKHVKIHCPSKAEENKKLFLQYLDYCNKKGHVFLEDYDPYEYNPFLLHLNHPKYFKVLLNDPLFKQSHGRMEEDAAILHCITVLSILQKQMLNCAPHTHTQPISHVFTETKVRKNVYIASPFCKRFWKMVMGKLSC